MDGEEDPKKGGDEVPDPLC